MSEENQTTSATSAESKPKKQKFVPLTITDEALAALDEEHDDILKLNGPEEAPWIVCLRRPTRAEVKAFKHHAKRDSTTANEQLIRAVCVFPDPKTQDFERQLTRWPFFVDGVADSESFKKFVGIKVDNDLKG